MGKLNKDDLAQMNRDYFQSLEKERLVEVADNLHRLAVEQWEKINSDSSNSSQPPSLDNPFKKASCTPKSNSELLSEPSNSSPNKSSNLSSNKRRKPGRQKGSCMIWTCQTIKNIRNNSSLSRKM